MEFKQLYGLKAWLFEVMSINYQLSFIDEEREQVRLATMLEF